MADITIVNGVYKPTYNWGAPSCRDIKHIFLHHVYTCKKTKYGEELTCLKIDIVHVSITLWWTNSLLLKMAIEIVDFPIKNGDFPLLC